MEKFVIGLAAGDNREKPVFARFDYVVRRTPKKATAFDSVAEARAAAKKLKIKGSRIIRIA